MAQRQWIKTFDGRMKKWKHSRRIDFIPADFVANWGSDRRKLFCSCGHTMWRNANNPPCGLCQKLEYIVYYANGFHQFVPRARSTTRKKLKNYYNKRKRTNDPKKIKGLYKFLVLS